MKTKILKLGNSYKLWSVLGFCSGLLIAGYQKDTQSQVNRTFTC